MVGEDLSHGMNNRKLTSQKDLKFAFPTMVIGNAVKGTSSVQTCMLIHHNAQSISPTGNSAFSKIEILHNKGGHHRTQTGTTNRVTLSPVPIHQVVSTTSEIRINNPASLSFNHPATIHQKIMNHAMGHEGSNLTRQNSRSRALSTTSKKTAQKVGIATIRMAIHGNDLLIEIDTVEFAFDHPS